MRTSLKAVLSRVNRLTERVQSEKVVDWDELVEILNSARTEPRSTVAPEVSAERLRALRAKLWGSDDAVTRGAR